MTGWRRFLHARGVAGAGAAVSAVLATQTLLAILGIGVWLLGRSLWPGVPDTPRPTPPADAARPASIESTYPLALERAQDWNAEARLVSVSQQVDWPLEVPDGTVTEVAGGGWIKYTFAAPWDDPLGPGRSATFGILIERFSASIVDEKVVTSELPAAVSVLDGVEFPVSSDEAVLEAETEAGTGYRRACPEVRRTSRVTLDTLTAETPAWLVTYQDVRYPDRNDLAIRVNVETGDVRTTVQTPEPCPA